MKNKQFLTIKQVQRLQECDVDLSGASSLWLKLDGESPMAVSKEFAKFFFLPETIKQNTICEALTLSDVVSMLPSSLLTENNLSYILTIQSAITNDGKKYRAGYVLQPFAGWDDEIETVIMKTGAHDNPLDAAYELATQIIAEDLSLNPISHE